MKKSLRVYPQKTPLRGTIRVPGDKSISHRAIMLAALADGTSHISDWLPAGDTLATLDVFRALGVSITVEEKSSQQWDLQIEGRGLHGLQPPSAPLDSRNAGTCMRLLAGIMAGQAFPSVLNGSEQLRKRPMNRIITPLAAMGAQIEADGGRAPMHITPSPLRGTRYEMPMASGQVKSAILLAGLYAEGKTAVFQPAPARDHTERMLSAMGIQITTNGGWVTLGEGERHLSPFSLTVPGDISSAAFPLVAAAIIPHSQVTIAGVGYNDTRTGLMDILNGMGVDFAVANQRVTGGETAVDLTITFSEMHSSDVGGGDTVVRAIDEFPIWAIAASQAAGRSQLRDAAELRVKEVDRISRLAGELRKLGMNVDEQPDGFAIDGSVRLHGAEVDSHGDHRLGMALAIAGLAADSPTIVHDAACMADSFPGFVETMRDLGAVMEWV